MKSSLRWLHRVYIYCVACTIFHCYDLSAILHLILQPFLQAYNYLHYKQWLYWRNKIMKNNYIFLHVRAGYLSFCPQRACDHKTIGSHLNRAWKKTEFCLALSIFQILLVLAKSWFVLLINIVGRWFNYLNLQKENRIILSLMTWQHFSGALLSN